MGLFCFLGQKSWQKFDKWCYEVALNYDMVILNLLTRQFYFSQVALGGQGNSSFSITQLSPDGIYVGINRS